MTPAERQALREKHTPKFLGAYEDGVKCCYECHDNDQYFRCTLCINYINNDGPYPCDVIKVLDELDRVINAAEVYGVYAQMMAENPVEQADYEKDEL